MSDFKTRVLCVDMEQDIIDFLKSESMEVLMVSWGRLLMHVILILIGMFFL